MLTHIDLVASDETCVKVIDKESGISARGYHVDPQKAADDAESRLKFWGVR